MSITSITYKDFETAFDFFEEKLFPNELPKNILLTLANHPKARGYYRHGAFECATKRPIKSKKAPKKDQHIIHELSLNPFQFSGRTREEILSTLVHEMVHLWEMQDVEKLPKSPTHTKKWADKMESVGLMPSHTGQPGGKRTGKKVTHYIIPGGPFDKAVKKCKIAFDFIGRLAEKEKKGSKRTKYSCPSCDLNAYGKPDINLKCGECDEQMEEVERNS